MKTKIRKIGKVHGLIIPKALLTKVGMKEKDSVDVKVENGTLVIALVPRDPRAGWAEASKRLAEAGEDGLVWPEFGNDEDKNLTW